mgnify:FL=1
MREDKTTDVKIKIEVLGKQVSLEKAVSDHELEEGVAALLNSALLLESTLNEWLRTYWCEQAERHGSHYKGAGRSIYHSSKLALSFLMSQVI